MQKARAKDKLRLEVSRDKRDIFRRKYNISGDIQRRTNMKKMVCQIKQKLERKRTMKVSKRKKDQEKPPTAPAKRQKLV